MLFPKVCRVCGRELVNGERKLCLHCVGAIPLWSASAEELRAHRFPRTAPVDVVLPWMTYSNTDPVCALIRNGKFNDRPELIEELGCRYADWLVAGKRIAGIDAIVPVPMHWWKRLLRGYNQAEIIARCVSDASGIPVVNALKAVRPHAVQSRKSGEQRAANVAGIFALRDDDVIPKGKRIALVDDILTTGSTLSEAIRALAAASPSSITVLTLAATRIL